MLLPRSLLLDDKETLLTKRATAIWLGLALLIVGTGKARSDTILCNDLSVTLSGNDPFSSFGSLADSFSAGASVIDLLDVKALQSGSPSDTGFTAVQLLSDNAGKPGALLATIGTFNNTSRSSTPIVFDFALNSQIDRATGSN